MFGGLRQLSRQTLHHRCPAGYLETLQAKRHQVHRCAHATRGSSRLWSCMQQPCANICTALVHEQVLACAQSLRHMHFSKLATRHSPKAYMKHFISGSPPPHSQIGCTLFRILNTAKAATRQMLMSVAMTGVYCTHDERCMHKHYSADTQVVLHSSLGSLLQPKRLSSNATPLSNRLNMN